MSAECRSAWLGRPCSISLASCPAAWLVALLVLGVLLSPLLQGGRAGNGPPSPGRARQAAGEVAVTAPAPALAGHRWRTTGEGPAGEIAPAGHRWGAAATPGSPVTVTLVGHRWRVAVSPGTPPPVAI